MISMFRRLLLPLLPALLLVGCAHGAATAARDLAMSQDALWSCRCAATSIATGIDGAGGAPKLWVAANNKVFEVSADGEATEVWSSPRFSRILRLEAADLDQDGSDEWVVLLDTGRMRSRVVALRDGVRVLVGKPWNGYLRPLRGPSGELTLVGQRTGGDRPFLGPVFGVEVAADLSLKSGASLGLPRDFPLFDFFWLPGVGEQGARLFSLESNGLLAERNAVSPTQVLWLSDARFVARPLQVEREYRGMLGDYRDGVVDFAPPVVLSGGGDQPDRAYVVSQPPRGPVVVEGFMLPRGGDARVLEPAPRGLSELARTPLMGRAVAGVAVWKPEPHEEVGAALVWTRLSGGVVAPETRLLLFDLTTGDLVTGFPGPMTVGQPEEASSVESSATESAVAPGEETLPDSGADAAQPAPAAE
ncbi:MAG TPA: hypothetical protein DIU15_18235 [Deltaproteobacteria bacterium]|nr:hypothetical protein [Deltaproteobacteria bacterium]